VVVVVAVLLGYVFFAYLPLARQLDTRRHLLAEKQQELAEAQELEQILEVELTPKERVALGKSAESVRESIAMVRL